MYVLLLLLSTAFATENHPYSPFLKLAGSLNAPSLVTNKLVSGGYQHKLAGLFDYQLEGGFFVDNPTHSKTVFISPSVGITSSNPLIYSKVFVGPTLITHTDEHLSTPYQFNIDLEAGIKDTRGNTIGVGYKHFSNAQLCNGCSNLGRDFLYLRVGF